jgi:hypothetical protein
VGYDIRLARSRLLLRAQKREHQDRIQSKARQRFFLFNTESRRQWRLCGQGLVVGEVADDGVSLGLRQPGERLA